MKKYPFKFLDAYEREDSAFFFGRKEEINALYEMVFQSQVVVIYGASGTGKTSLINCGLSGKFQTHDWQSLIIRRGANINDALAKAITDAGGESPLMSNDMMWLDEVMHELPTKSGTREASPLIKSLKAVYHKTFRPIYLIFDQFEELFILGSSLEQEKFIETVKEIIKVESHVKMIISIREEYLYHLDKLERVVPDLLQKKIRIEPMGLNKVRQVIEGATTHQKSNVTLKQGESEVIVQRIFEKIKNNERTLTIELPYLQVLLDKLYRTVTKDDEQVKECIISIETLSAIGSIGDVLRDFLEEQVDKIAKTVNPEAKPLSLETCWNILSPFATLEGTKEPINKADLYQRLLPLQPNLLNAVLSEFIKSRILRYNGDSDMFELAHDSLAQRLAERRTTEEVTLLEIKRLIKYQSSLKADALELFSEKQLNFIGPFLDKINIAPAEQNLITQSYDAVEKQKDEEKKLLRREAKNLKDRQALLEAKEKTQSLLIKFIVAALIVLAVVALWAYGQKRLADKNAQQLMVTADSVKNALQENIRQQVRAKANEIKRFGDSYSDLGKKDFACASYRAALDSLRNFPDTILVKELQLKIKLCE